MTYDARLQMRLDARTAQRLDDLRRRQADLPSRSELIRRLIDQAWQEAADPLPSVSAMLASRPPPAAKPRRTTRRKPRA